MASSKKEGTGQTQRSPQSKKKHSGKAAPGLTSGNIDSHVQVTPEGAATVDIPLWVPPGRAGMQPSVSFQYDSRRGNDLLGVGWTLSVSSSITRCERDHFHDGYAKPIAFDSSDAFCLDGQRLVLVSGTHGEDGAEYRTHRNSFKKIILNQPDKLGPTSFTVYDKGGNILTFGPDDTSRITANKVTFFIPPTGENNVVDWEVWDDLNGIVPQFGNPVRYGWLLTEIRDRSGNNILFTWFDFNNQKAPAFYGQPSTEKLLQEINYTSKHFVVSKHPQKPLKAGRRIVFNYEQRLDVRDEFIPGIRLWHPARLTSVEMYGPDPHNQALLRIYQLAYKLGSTGRSLLTSITETDGHLPHPTSKPPLVFAYQDNVPDYEDIDTGISDILTTPAGRSGLPGRIQVMDIDGDGRDDILYASATRVGYYSFRLSRIGPNGLPILSPEYQTNIPLSARLDRPIPFDFDGDGKTELLTFDDTYYYTGDGSIGTQYFICSLSNNPMTGQLTLAPSSTFVADVAEICDLDGDGRPDLIYSLYNDNGTPIRNWNYALNISGLFGYPNVVPEVGPDDHYLVDIDGDGAVEVLTCLGQPGGPAPVPGDWFSVLKLGRPQNEPLGVCSLRTNETYLFVDLNGDGLLDAVWEGTSSNDLPSVILNSGNGFFAPVGQPFGNLAYYGDPVKRVIDYNLDGKKEVVIRYNTAFAPDPVIVVGWNEETFGEPVVLPFGSICTKPDQAAVFEILDLSGNGLDDMIMYNNGTLHLYVRKGTKPDLLTSFTNGYGAQTTIGYKPTSDPSVYHPDIAPLAYPQQRHLSKMWVVSDHSVDDGKGGANHYTHFYVNGRSDLRLPAFAGFAGYYRTHTETGEIFRADFDLTDRGNPGPFGLRGLPVLTSLRTPMGGGSGLTHVVIEQTQYIIQYDASDQSYFPVAQTITHEESMQESNNLYQISKTVINRQVDAFGNETQVLQTWDSGRKTQANSIYANNEATWLINLKQLFTVQDITDLGVTQIRRIGYEHNDYGLLTRLVLEPGPLNGTQWTAAIGPQPDGVRTLFTSYQYNAYGLVTQKTIHDTQIPGANARNTSYVYDAVESIFPVEEINALGHITTTAYHPGLGVPLSKTDPNGIVTAYLNDSFGRLTQINEAGGAATNFSYLNGPLYPPIYSVERVGGAIQAFHYDSLGRLVQLSTWKRDDGKETQQLGTFDSLGRLSSLSMEHFPGSTTSWYSFRYDALNRMLVAYLPDGTSWKYVYGDSHPPYGFETLRSVQAQDPRGNSRFSYQDESGRVIRNTEFDGASSVTGKVSYGPFDIPAAFAGPGNQPTRTVVDRLGRTLSINDPDAGIRSVRYNAFGDLVKSEDPNGVTKYSYDLLGRMTHQDGPDGLTTYIWDTELKGFLSETDSPFDIQMRYQYDSAGRISTKQWTTSTGAFLFQYTYDAYGRLNSLQFPDISGQPSLTIGYDYGQFGQLLAVTNNATSKTFWKLSNSDATGAFGRWVLGNGITEEWLRTPAGQDIWEAFVPLMDQILSSGWTLSLMQQVICHPGKIWSPEFPNPLAMMAMTG